ncbi:hypothetical protein L9F63_018509, partial [Diploptera punctata]
TPACVGSADDSRRNSWGVELGSMERRTRFQVNRVDAGNAKDEDGEEGEPLRGDDERGSRRGSMDELQRATSPTMLISHGSDHDGYDTRYAKSFRHFTREALPRLDNYRNIMSIQAAYRPTLDELHNATLHNKTVLGCSRFLHFPTIDGCNATLNSPIVICCCIFNAILTND